MSDARRRWSGRYDVVHVDAEAGPLGRLILRVDIDGPTPLGVLSLAPHPDDGSGDWALLARVELRARSRGQLELRARAWTELGVDGLREARVLDVRLHAPTRGREVEVEVEVEGAAGSLGCWRGRRVSAAFRSVRLDVAWEPGAQALPPMAACP